MDACKRLADTVADDDIPMLVDMHCHLGFSPRFVELAHRIAAEGMAAFCNTVTPGEFKRLRDSTLQQEIARCPAKNLCASGDGVGSDRVVLGLGLHPWQVAQADEAGIESYLREFEDLLPQTHTVGEIGLDFSATRTGTEDVQKRVFRRVLEICAAKGSVLLSVHAVKSAAAALDVIETTGVLKTCQCIFHWFSGSSQDLGRAVSMGCWFSVGSPMVASRRGREYIKAIPSDRILLETDLPAEDGCELDPAQMRRALLDAASHIGELDYGWSLGEANRASLGLLGIA